MYRIDILEFSFWYLGDGDNKILIHWLWHFKLFIISVDCDPFISLIMIFMVKIRKRYTGSCDAIKALYIVCFIFPTHKDMTKTV